MDGNTAAAEQLAARTKMDCITHTIFLADGAFLEPGMIIDRYGSNGTGKYFSPLGTPYSEIALPPYMKNEPYTKYKVLVSFEVKSGEIVPWFDEVGGGTQYRSTYSVDEFKKFGYIVKVE